MNFRVEPDDLDGFGKLIGRAADDAGRAADYTSNAKLEATGGQLWDMVAGDHDDHVHEAKKTLQKLQSILNSGSAELGRSAKYYKETDREQAAKLDATYPGSKKTVGEHSGKGAGDFTDAEDAASSLKSAGGGDSYIDGHVAEYKMNPASKQIGTALDIGSPSAWIVELSKLTIGFDPYDFVNGMVLGSWGEYNDCSEVWGNLGKFCDSLHHNIKKGNEALSATWDGNSADAAWVYFDELSQKIIKIKGAFDSLKENYSEAAHYVFELGETLKSLLAGLADQLLAWGATWVASRAAALVPGGGWIGSAALMALAAAQLIVIMETWNTIASTLDAASKALGLINTTMRAGIAAFSSVKDFPVVGSGYDNKAV
ncbi:hypothetical protein HEP86_19730 [Streptomyces sp. RPA4-5]|uniref:type VII secretion target n=1 Tax=Streptomyces sp. RPA4-5 TaxID=2721245 RepID=UPI00143ECB37|nr:type VII secretion target [Streptomyces sp. RPA4-5]QIY56347.1 hypothetical protein HEP86_19730 [Streptomyces sp. RPA4-5]